MMRRWLVSMAIVMMAFSYAPAARANTITFSDTFDPTDVLMTNQNPSVACTGTNTTPNSADSTTAMSAGCTSLTWSHILGPGSGYLNGDSLLSASLRLTLYDDDNNDPDEHFALTVDLASFASNVPVTDGSSAGTPFTISYNVLSKLSDNTPPRIDLVLTPGAADTGNHDFRFANSVLTGTADRDPVPTVPEPTSLLLLGPGLVGAASRFRRRRTIP